MKYDYPNNKGEFGQYGGRIVPSELGQVLVELERAYNSLKKTKKFQRELTQLYRDYVGRPSLLYLADMLSGEIGGAKIYLKREDLNHTGAHKINNTVGQALVAKHLGKKKLIAETGAGQHGVAVATVAAKFGMDCDVYMGARDVENQNVNVYRMKLLGAKVIPVTQGQGSLKDAVDAALGAYSSEPGSYYMLGSVVGPHPYPMMVRDFQAVIGREAKQQLLEVEGRLPDVAVACVGGGSNAMGLFYEFIPDEAVRLIGVEPAGKGVNSGKHGLALMKGKLGVIHGYRCRVLQDETGKVLESYSAASGLDYPGVGPELSSLADMGRLEVEGVTDKEAVAAMVKLSRTEGIIPALESAHAVAYAMKLSKKLAKDKIILVNLSGRGDKDVKNVYENLM